MCTDPWSGQLFIDVANLPGEAGLSWTIMVLIEHDVRICQPDYGSEQFSLASQTSASLYSQIEIKIKIKIVLGHFLGLSTRDSMFLVP